MPARDHSRWVRPGGPGAYQGTPPDVPKLESELGEFRPSRRRGRLEGVGRGEGPSDVTELEAEGSRCPCW